MSTRSSATVVFAVIILLVTTTMNRYVSALRPVLIYQRGLLQHSLFGINNNNIQHHHYNNARRYFSHLSSSVKSDEATTSKASDNKEKADLIENVEKTSNSTATTTGTNFTNLKNATQRAIIRLHRQRSYRKRQQHRFTESTWWKKTAATASAATGFISQAFSSLWSDYNQVTRNWIPLLRSVLSFMQSSGLSNEMMSTLMQRQIIGNLILLYRIQNMELFADRRKLGIAQDNDKIMESIPDFEEAFKYMRYATAIYGKSMMRASTWNQGGTGSTQEFIDELWQNASSANLTVDKLRSSFNRTVSSSSLTKAWNIADYVDIPEENVVYVDPGPAVKGMHHLKHFVAVDHESETIILSIRGTFTMADLLVDVAGFSRPFCGGEAHAEIASMAERVWEVSGQRILDLLEENPDYELVLTGHSLGAGTACLLNVMLHENDNERIKGRNVRCFAFASPPVFSSCNLVPRAAKDCTNYLHQRDVVPFLSVDAVRHWLAALSALHDYTSSMPIWDRWQLTAGVDRIDKEMKRAVNKGREERLPALDGAPILEVPALASVWLYQDDPDKPYEFCLCDPDKMAKIGLMIDPYMILDHVPINYERALDQICDQYNDEYLSDDDNDDDSEDARSSSK